MSRPCLDVGIHSGKDDDDSSADNFALENKESKPKAKQGPDVNYYINLRYSIVHLTWLH